MKPYIAFRKRFILPVKYLFEEMGMLRRISYPDRGDLLLRLDELRKELIVCLKKQKKDEAKILEVRIAELEWVAYGSTKA